MTWTRNHVWRHRQACKIREQPQAIASKGTRIGQLEAKVAELQRRVLQLEQKYKDGQKGCEVGNRGKEPAEQEENDDDDDDDCWHAIAHPRTSCIVGQEITHKMTLNTTHNRVPRIASTDSRGHRNARLVCIPASFLFIFCMSLHHNETNPRTHIHGSKSARH